RHRELDLERQHQGDSGIVANSPGGCPASNHDCGAKQCAPTYVSAASGNYHLLGTDSCARDGGFTLAGVVDTDIDGERRPGGASWDMGADEVVLSGTSAPAAP